ncbi:Na+/H+ antiporter [Paracoccus contaminans]|uniref:Na+/H+ antiporter n=1 Tax=Paracoccus contaminans TaxID=1945662 RepID=A0A1W6CVP2_9RHOB|nr:Na+/H+ antiporter [Paracoccus contaminans]ARJ68948.1 Na+/H+ antiporter [Paracoccus contaminans]
MSVADTFELTLALLTVIVGLYWLALTLRLPPSAALLVGSGALAFVPGLPHFVADPDLVLVLFLPPLLMDGAFSTSLGRFGRQLPGILSLAIGMVVFTTLAVGVVTHWLVPSLPWAACFALGAIVSPPDAVSARAVLQSVTLPRRLTALIEGESLVNDATGLVLFRFAVAAALSGVFDAGAVAADFARLFLGGVLVGLAAGAAWVVVARRMRDETLTLLVSLLLSWLSYLAGERLHVSGVISTVTAGLVMGWYQHVIFSAAVRLRGIAFNSVLVFVLEAMVFILIGFSLRDVVDRMGGMGAVASTMAVPLAGVVLAVILARFVWIFATDGMRALLSRAGMRGARPLGMRQAAVLGWAGMRGGVTLAIALTLPETMPGRDLMLVAAFAVIFATVVVQGTSLAALIGWVKPQDLEPPAPMSLAEAETALARVRLAVIEQNAYGPNGSLVHAHLLDQAQMRVAATEQFVHNHEQSYPRLVRHFDLLNRSIDAARAELIRLHRAGQIEDEVLHNLERDLDIEQMGLAYQLNG